MGKVNAGLQRGQAPPEAGEGELLPKAMGSSALWSACLSGPRRARQPVGPSRPCFASQVCRTSAITVWPKSALCR